MRTISFFSNTQTVLYKDDIAFFFKKKKEKLVGWKTTSHYNNLTLFDKKEINEPIFTKLTLKRL